MKNFHDTEKKDHFKPFKSKGKSSSKERQDYRHSNSIVKIFCDSIHPNYARPYGGLTNSQCSGTGSVIELNGKKYILTDAHVVSDGTRINVRLVDDFVRYTTKPIVIGHDCDLALLEVTGDNRNEFLDHAIPLKMGEMRDIGEKINVLGFPIGGEELCTTEGIISRMQVDTYLELGVPFLQQQVEAAINPGNSGGPVIFEGKQVGVAFQGYTGGDGLGYIIPPPIIQTFLRIAEQCILHNIPYSGFPDLEFTYQTMENETLRESYGLRKDQSGILVRSVDRLSSARDILNKNDVILKIDDIPISNTGKVLIKPAPKVGRKPLDFNHLFHTKILGDLVKFTVIRDRKELELSIPLVNTAHSTKKIGPTVYERMPAYYIASGILFQPLTPNLLMSLLENLNSSEDDAEMGILASIGALCETSKKRPNDQIVIMTRIFPSEITDGYQNSSASIIKQINGKKIHNMDELKNAFESNEDPVHTIITRSKNRMVVKNLGAPRHRELILDRFEINHDRSLDLCTEEQARLRKDPYSISWDPCSSKFSDLRSKEAVSPSLLFNFSRIPMEITSDLQTSSENESDCDEKRCLSDPPLNSSRIQEESDHESSMSDPDDFLAHPDSDAELSKEECDQIAAIMESAKIPEADYHKMWEIITDVVSAANNSLNANETESLDLSREKPKSHSTGREFKNF